MSSSGRDHRSSRNYNVCRACAGAAANTSSEISSSGSQLSVSGYRQFSCRRCVTVFLDRCTLSARIQHIFSLDQEGDIPSAALFYLQRAFPLCPTRIDIHAVQCQTCVCILLHTDRTLGQVRAIMALRTVEGQFRSVLYVENTRTPVVSIAGGITLYDQIRRCQLSQLILLVITNKPYNGTSFKADLRICIFLILGKIQVDLSLFIRLYALKIIICTRHIRDCRLRTIHCGQIYDRLRDRVRAICGTGDRIIYCFQISGIWKPFCPDRSTGNDDRTTYCHISFSDRRRICSTSYSYRSPLDPDIRHTSAYSATNPGCVNSSDRYQFPITRDRQLSDRRCLSILLDRCAVYPCLQHIPSLDRDRNISGTVLFYQQRTLPRIPGIQISCPTHIDIHAVQSQVCICILLHIDDRRGRVFFAVALCAADRQFRAIHDRELILCLVVRILVRIACDGKRTRRRCLFNS